MHQRTAGTGNSYRIVSRNRGLERHSRRSRAVSEALRTQGYSQTNCWFDCGCEVYLRTETVLRSQRYVESCRRAQGQDYWTGGHNREVGHGAGKPERCSCVVHGPIRCSDDCNVVGSCGNRVAGERCFTRTVRNLRRVYGCAGQVRGKRHR